MDDVRSRFAILIRMTPNLDWLLLTKRPENLARMLPAMFEGDLSTWPTNFRIGTTVENQETADKRLDDLLAIDWPNFVSFEPMLSRIDVRPWLPGFDPDQPSPESKCPECSGDVACEFAGWRCVDHIGMTIGCGWSGDEPAARRWLDWGIVGGESGSGSRPMYPGWPLDLRNQFLAAGIPFLFKQWGDWIPADQFPGTLPKGIETRAQFPDGHDLMDLTGRGENGTEAVRVVRVGKAKAGRLLDGILHDGYPDFGRQL